MAWVRFHGKLYRLPTQQTFDKTRFRLFQERNRDSEVLIYAPEGGHDRVPLLKLEYAGEDREAFAEPDKSTDRENRVRDRRVQR